MTKIDRGRRLLDWFLLAMFVALAWPATAQLVPHMEQARQMVGFDPVTHQPLFQPVPGRWYPAYRGNGGTMALPALCMVVLIPVVRRRPLTAAAILSAAILFGGSVHAPGGATYASAIAADLFVYAIAARGPRRTSLFAAGLVLAGTWTVFVVFPPGDSTLMTTHVAVTGLLLAVAWLIGDSVRERRANAERRRLDVAVQAVATERLRIARELHDMIAHSIGIIAIQAGMGNRVITTQPGEARKALAAIEETSRDTLSQLRRTLTALREGDVEGTPHAPAPGLADLDKLVASTRHAGVLVVVETRGMPRPLPGEIDLAAYRIVQESVTNVVRHAGVRTCRVVVEYGDGDVSITVADDGHGVLGSSGTGFGLVGMRERVSLVHGEFSAGPRPGGGFLVSARLPVPGGFGTTYKKSAAPPEAAAPEAAAPDSAADAQPGAAEAVAP